LFQNDSSEKSTTNWYRYKGAGQASASRSFEACSAFTHVSACLLAESPKAIRYIKGFDELVTSSTALIATGWSDPSPDGNLTR